LTGNDRHRKDQVMGRKRSVLAGKDAKPEVFKHSLNLSAEENRLLFVLKHRAETEILEGPHQPYMVDMSDILRAGLQVLEPKSGKQLLELLDQSAKKRSERKAS
jgi:hypothetical protein